MVDHEMGQFADDAQIHPFQDGQGIGQRHRPVRANQLEMQPIGQVFQAVVEREGHRAIPAFRHLSQMMHIGDGGPGGPHLVIGGGEAAAKAAE